MNKLIVNTVMASIICLLLESCEKPQSNSNKSHKDTNKVAVIETDDDDNWGYDTLVLSTEKDAYGNKIICEGSKSGGLYRISIVNSKGKRNCYQIASESYGALHSQVVWSNKDYIFVRSGQGTNAWSGKIIPKIIKDKIYELMYYCYSDSIDNVVIYPKSTANRDLLICENIKSRKRFEIQLKNYIEYVKIYGPDSIIRKSKNYLTIYYSDKKHNLIKKDINISSIL